MDPPWVFRHLDVVAEVGMIEFVHSHANPTIEAPLGLGRLALAARHQNLRFGTAHAAA